VEEIEVPPDEVLSIDQHALHEPLAPSGSVGRLARLFQAQLILGPPGPVAGCFATEHFWGVVKLAR
jgi:hypothetical protein